MASIRWVRPAFTTVGELRRLRLQRPGQVRQRGQQVVDDRGGGGQVDRGGEDVVAGLGGVHVVVRVHLAGPARGWPGWRSPRWRSCSTRCPSRSGTRRSGTGRRSRRRPRARRRRRSRSATFASSTPSSALTSAAAPLIWASARIWAGSSPRPEIGKFSTARWVCARHSASAGTSTSPIVSCSIRYPVASGVLTRPSCPAMLARLRRSRITSASARDGRTARAPKEGAVRSALHVGDVVVVAGAGG